MSKMVIGVRGSYLKRIAFFVLPNLIRKLMGLSFIVIRGQPFLGGREKWNGKNSLP
jgi:hypothetical protein